MLCRRVQLDLDAAEGASLTIWQPSFALTSDRGTFLNSGLTDRVFLTGALTYLRAGTDAVTITVGGATPAAATDVALAAEGWLQIDEFDPEAVITVAASA